VISNLQSAADADPQTIVNRTAGRDGILLISYHFPPSAAVGGRRMANFATSLRSLGWDAHALTIPDSAAEQIDRARLSAVQGIPIHVARVWPTMASVITAVLRLRSANRRGAPASAAPPVHRTDAARGESIVRRARRYVMSFALLPDAEKGWCVPAIVQAVRTIRRHRLGWFMTSCPPYSVHLIGLAVQKLSGARWVADFRDPWMTTGSKRLFPTCAASIAIESWLERQVIEQADLVVFNVERLRNAYRARYSHVSSEKLVFIPNGVAAAPASVAAATKYERFTICYTGSLYVGRSPEPVFKAVSRLIREATVGRDAIRIMLVGQCRVIDGVRTDVVVRQHGLESIVEMHDQVPYAQAFEMIRRSHLALLLAPNLPYQIPAKVYDYLGAGTRILAIAEEGGTSDLLKETGSGSAFTADDVDGIAAFILEELGDGSRPAQGPSALGRYDVNRITNDLLEHLARVPRDSCGRDAS
jgi:glycosyltransferase involved in cell wall biosynthesis